jgi:hypothetical protein
MSGLILFLCRRIARFAMVRVFPVLLLLPIALGMASCKEEPLQVPLDEVPYIEVRAANPGTVRALADSLVLSIYYTDADGDLGFAEADSAVVYVTDARFPLTETFHVPPMAPEGSVVAITGVWEVVLDRLILADPAAAAETVELSVRIRDRAGHWSNEAFAPPVTVVQL